MKYKTIVGLTFLAQIMVGVFFWLSTLFKDLSSTIFLGVLFIAMSILLFEIKLIEHLSILIDLSFLNLEKLEKGKKKRGKKK